MEERVRARTTELSAANLALADLAAIMEYSNDAISSTDQDHRITTWNPAAELKLGEHISSFETIRIRKTGESINVSLTLSPIKNEAWLWEPAGTSMGFAKTALNFQWRSV